MKKATLSRFHTYGLVGLGIFCSIILSTSSSVLTKTPNHTSRQQKTIPASEFIWPTQGIVSQGFRKYSHEGIDIAGASGTPVVAAASGTVIKAGWDDWGLGKAIAIKHSDGKVTVYGHNSRLLVSKGKQVTQGQIIAAMGSSGNSTAPHLHFEIHSHGGLAVDPSSLLSSTIAGKTPPQQIANSASKKVAPQVVSSPTVSPSKPIPVEVLPKSTNTECNGNTVIQGETANAFVKVCQENGQLFYIGQLKQEPTKPIRLQAINIDTTKYRADNGSFSYFVTPNGVEIWRNGSLVRSDHFYTAKRLPS
ncbi:peptidoglycan DD-metalloendopeptidase family protein [Chlorogloeopsis sp. ULAP01]|uniref:M23 family metallopeptidase n=1 Tax=Chlorogloeopsis sp. ULAP01 TaxID=3056483 RepID=UPI0025AA7E1B|nr:peptidoglycan DD-metalloendopeptidase family protein [Chlorogloeopsis sp. ULAP01]MDM9380173.1 peptidoglycan DD-metalloendopeptidase family protein [Chlorogloeopsis sp. ULAP01]